LYFYDTGLLCSLLNVSSPDQLATHFAKGAIFENYVLAELLKTRFNKGLEANMYFWRDNHDKEIDCLVDNGGNPLAIEIKSAATFTPSFLENIDYWKQLSPANKIGALVYGGDQSYTRKDIQVIAWNKLDRLPVV
ncbi:MAG TPA: DUF4143 domain-containing protein, partial [Puia sp.]|nr:DUF4143 domain-containing protein [Puia sp.]